MPKVQKLLRIQRVRSGDSVGIEAVPSGFSETTERHRRMLPGDLS